MKKELQKLNDYLFLNTGKDFSNIDELSSDDMSEFNEEINHELIARLIKLVIAQQVEIDKLKRK